MKKEAKSIPSLEVIHELEYAVLKADVVKTALELDIFSAIDKGNHTLDELVQALKCDRRALAILLDVLCPLGLLTKSGSSYSLTPTSEVYLVRGKPTFYGDWTLRTQLAWEVRMHSADAIRSGKAIGGDYADPSTDDEWVMDYSSSLLNWPDRAKWAREMWTKSGVYETLKPPYQVLEPACGPGVKSFVLAQDNKDTEITALDFPHMLKLTRKIAEAMGVVGQVEFKAGDISTSDFGTDEYDIILLGLILYYFKGVRLDNILQRVHKALKSGGIIVINERLLDESESENEAGLLVAYQLLLFAPDSEVRTFTDYSKILKRNGFGKVSQRGDTLLTAVKEDAS